MRNLHTAQAEFHLSDTEVSTLFDTVKLRSKSTHSLKNEKRKSHRFVPFNHKAMAAFEHPGGSTDTCHALLLDISTEGVRLAVRGFLHNGTTISITINTNDGEEYPISGVVRWCDYFDKQIHMIGVSLFETVDPRNFASEADWATLAINNDDTTWMVQRTALVIENDPIEFKATNMLLFNANFTISKANTFGAALDLIKESPFDLLILNDPPDNDQTTQQSIEQLTLHGFTAPIIVLSKQAKAHKNTLLNSGAQTVIQRPAELAVFLSELSDIFKNESSDLIDSTTPIYSSLSMDHCSESFFSEYIDLVNESIPRLEVSIKMDDQESALQTCLSLYSTGSSFGFPLLTSAAHQAVQSLNASASPKESAPQIRKLIHLIRRLKAPQPQKSPPKRRFFNK